MDKQNNINREDCNQQETQSVEQTEFAEQTQPTEQNNLIEYNDMNYINDIDINMANSIYNIFSNNIYNSEFYSIRNEDTHNIINTNNIINITNDFNVNQLITEQNDDHILIDNYKSNNMNTPFSGFSLEMMKNLIAEGHHEYNSNGPNTFITPQFTVRRRYVDMSYVIANVDTDGMFTESGAYLWSLYHSLDDKFYIHWSSWSGSYGWYEVSRREVNRMFGPDRNENENNNGKLFDFN